MRPSNKKLWLVLSTVLAIGTLTAIMMLSLGGGATSTANAETVSNNAINTINNMKSLHMVTESTMYSDGQPYQIVRDEVWIDFPKKIYVTEDSYAPNNRENVRRSIIKSDGKDMAVLTCDGTGGYSFAQVFLNIVPFPSCDFAAYPITRDYTAPIEQLFESSEFEVLSREVVGGKEAIKVKYLGSGSNTPEYITVENYLYVDVGTSVILKEESYGNGKLTSEKKTEIYELNVEVDEGLFKTEVPAGLTADNGKLIVTDSGYTVLDDIDQLDMVLGIRNIEPRYLPEGYKLVEAGYIDNNRILLDNKKASPSQVWQQPVFLTYSDGDNYLYILEDKLGADQEGNLFAAIGYEQSTKAREVQLEEGMAYLIDKGVGCGTLYFETGGMKIEVTGALDIEEAKSVSNSLVSE